MDDLGVFSVNAPDLLDLVSGGDIGAGAGANTGCSGNATCGSYNNTDCAPKNYDCGVAIIDGMCGANNSCPLVNVGTCGGSVEHTTTVQVNVPTG
jgi:hypothetical protein